MTTRDQYIKLSFTIGEHFSDILIAELDLLGFDSYEILTEQLDAYIRESLFNEEALTELSIKYQDLFSVRYSYHKLEEKNWNEEWEKHFDPVLISGRCHIRASFHPPNKKIPYEVIINPKMSFGTGHHETTYQMIEHQLAIPHTGKRIMDVGSGTGILSILSEQLGATEVLAIDIEDWAVSNMHENIALNKCKNIQIRQGTVKKIAPKGEFSIILANINKNVLLKEIPSYSALLAKKGILLLSGFYLEDSSELEYMAQKTGLAKIKESSKNNWACLEFQKN